MRLVGRIVDQQTSVVAYLRDRILHHQIQQCIRIVGIELLVVIISHEHAVDERTCSQTLAVHHRRDQCRQLFITRDGLIVRLVLLDDLPDAVVFVDRNHERSTESQVGRNKFGVLVAAKLNL